LDGAHLGELLDFYGGVRDLDQGVIRVLHSLSFIDDPTRILRAVRLEQRLGFRISNRTAELIKAALPMLNRITGDRVRSELELCLGEERRISIMERLAELGVFAEIHPGLVWRPQTAEAYERAEQVLADPVWSKAMKSEPVSFVYFALLLIPLNQTVQSEVMTWLKVRKTTREDVAAASFLVRDLAKMPADIRPSQVVKLLKDYPERVLLVSLAATNPNTAAGRQIEVFFRELRFVRTAVNGDDLLEMGLKAGPQIGQILETLLAARLDGQVVSDSSERALLAELVDSIRATESS
jgi:tRNA nucleotidyltransferase (CCA-adding enzyme)